MTRVRKLIERFIRARSFGVNFFGQSRFVMPHRVKLCNRTVELSLPPEPMLASDFVNLALDDEYGLREADDPKTIIDVGANVGLFSLLARHYFPDSIIRAYE